MRLFPGILLLCSLLPAAASAQCAPAPDSAYFFRNLSEQRAEARIAGSREADDASGRRHFYAIREYRLVEHRKGFAVANYLLIEGSTGGGETRAAESWLREVYEVLDGHWQLTSVEVSPVQDEKLTRAAR